MRLGLIVRADDSGLGSQTRNLCKLLKPDRLLIVDSTSFNNNKQHFEWYDGFESIITKAWPTIAESREFTKGLTHIFSAETMYNNEIYNQAKIHGTKTYIHCNYEFTDQLRDTSMPTPHYWVMPSYWKNKEMNNLFRRVIYLPPPLFLNEFKEVREKNMARKNERRRYLHVLGRAAVNDRNGTRDLIKALVYSTADFELVIKSQFEIEGLHTNDSRVRFDIKNTKETADLYKDFDAMILPRRYGGLCLPMNEALASGLPVIMTDISPNDEALPKEWLVRAIKEEQIMTRTIMQTYSVDYSELGAKLNWLSEITQDKLDLLKVNALYIAHENYSSDVLKPQYMELFNL